MVHPKAEKALAEAKKLVAQLESYEDDPGFELMSYDAFTPQPVKSMYSSATADPLEAMRLPSVRKDR